MPVKGGTLSAESRKKVSESQKERLRLHPHTEEYKQKQSEIQKERHRLHPETEETKKKKSNKLKLHYQLHERTPEHCQKLSDANKGQQTWLGKHHTEESKAKMRASQKGKHIGNKSNTGRHLTEEHKQHIREGCKGINTGKREPFSEEWRRKLGDVNRGKQRIFTPEHKKHMAIAHEELWKRIRISKPQKELFELLKQVFPDATLELPIMTNVTCRFADIGIPSLKIDFEYDGEYWHGNDERKLKDRNRDIELAEVGWMTFRINKKILTTLSQNKLSIKEIIKQ